MDLKPNFEVETRNRIIRLEQKIDFLLRELNLTEKEAAANTVQIDPILAETINLLRQGKTAGAVAFYSKQKGVGLREAKAVIDQYM